MTMISDPMSLEHVVLIPPRTIEWGMDKSICTRGDVLINSGYLTPCIGIFIYHPAEQRAFAGHFLSGDDGMLDRFVQKAVKKLKDPRHLIVYLAGNSKSRFVPDKVDALRERSYVTSLLHASGLDKGEIVARWSPLETTAFATLDLRTGEADLVLQTEGWHQVAPNIFYDGPFRDAPVYAPDWDPRGHSERR